MKSVYCIIITYNGIKWVEKCFGSIRKADLTIKTIVIDNGSTDGTQEAIQKNFPEVELIQSKENLGFGKANNLGIRLAIEQGADYIFLLNQDAYLFKGSVRKLIESFNINPLAGIISPLHLSGDEENFDYRFNQYINPKDTPNLLNDLSKGLLKKNYQTQFVNAAAWFMKSEMIKKIGIFHLIFDHYGEDAEYIYRLQSNNYKVYISTECTIVHDRPQYTPKSRDKRYAIRQKQDIIYSYCIGQKDKFQVHLSCIKVITYNLFLFNFKYCKQFFGEWVDIKRKINKLESGHFNYNID